MKHIVVCGVMKHINSIPFEDVSIFDEDRDIGSTAVNNDCLSLGKVYYCPKQASSRASVEV